MYYRVCPNCCATLDCGERCDCIKKERSETETLNKNNAPEVYIKSAEKARLIWEITK